MVFCSSTDISVFWIDQEHESFRLCDRESHGQHGSPFIDDFLNTRRKFYLTLYDRPIEQKTREPLLSFRPSYHRKSIVVDKCPSPNCWCWTNSLLRLFFRCPSYFSSVYVDLPRDVSPCCCCFRFVSNLNFRAVRSRSPGWL